MGSCRKIKANRGSIPKHELALYLKKNVESSVGRLNNEELLQSRILSCVACHKFKLGEYCSVLGFCSSAKNDFYKKHLNREKGRCPIGRW